MSRRFKVDPFDLLGQNELFPIAVYLPGRAEPNFTIAWNSFHQNFFSEVAAFFTWTRLPKGGPPNVVFRDWRIPRSIPARAILAAALWHVAFFIVPWPKLPIFEKRNNPFENTELTWSGPIDDLPLLNVPKRAPKAHSKIQVPDPPAKATDAYHPRQRIFTDAVHPTHPRQTLVRPNEPNEAPKFLPALPNMVQLASTAGPAKPKLEISEQTLAKLRPKQVKHVATTDTPTADAPNLETRPADMNLAALPTEVERPKLEMNAGSAPRLADQTRKGEAVPAPELAAPNATAGGPAETIIALSSAPAPPAPVVEVPKGNAAARVAISPEGRGSGSAGASSSASEGGGDAAAKSPVGISISGGNPKPNASVAGAGAGIGKLTLPRAQAGYKRPDPDDDPPERTGPPNFGALPPGTPPEQIFAHHHVYSMNVNMPNLNSVTGSWIIRFSELHSAGAAPVNGDLSAPVPVRKVDPKYPQSAILEHIQGEVILYGVIRPDGSVDSIQVVRGVDPQLDANSVAAFAQWKFEPASKAGQPVALEAIVHIPFRGPEPE